LKLVPVTQQSRALVQQDRRERRSAPWMFDRSTTVMC